MTDETARKLLADPSTPPDIREEAAAILEPMLTLDDMYGPGFDPWAAEDANHNRVVYATAWGR